MNTNVPNQQSTITQNSVPPESPLPEAPVMQDTVVMQSSSPVGKNNFLNVIIILLILIVILLAGFFAYTKLSSNKNTNSLVVTPSQQPSPTVIISPTMAVVSTVNPTLSTSDEIESLQNDVNGTDLTVMDQDAQEIDKNLQGL